jgi:hypothetical protein
MEIQSNQPLLTCVLLPPAAPRSVYVDPASRTALVDAGALAVDLDRETALHGCAHACFRRHAAHACVSTRHSLLHSVGCWPGVIAA